MTVDQRRKALNIRDVERLGTVRELLAEIDARDLLFFPQREYVEEI